MTNRPLLAALLLIAATLLAYAPVTRAGFVWDDDAHISHNDTLRSASGLRAIWATPGATMQYYPLTFSAWWVGYRLWGASPLGYHLLTLALHVAASLLLFRVLELLIPEGAWAGAMIFALHPVNVMSVAWATELKNTLSGSLALGACWAYLRFAAIGGPALEPRRRRLLYATSLALFLLALLAKTAVGLLPLTLLLVVWWKKERLVAADLLALVPLLLVAIGTGLVTVYVELHSGGAFGHEFSIPYLDRMLISGRSFWFYLGKLLVPHRLSFIYERWAIDRGDPTQWLYPAATAALLAGLFVARKRIGKGPFVAALHYFVATAGLIFVVVTYMTRYAWVSDHWQYFGMMSGTAFLGAVIARTPRPGALLALLLPILGALTFAATLPYRDAETLFLRTLDTTPRAFMPLGNLGALRRDQGRYAEALDLLNRALAIAPDNEETLNNRGDVRLRLGQYREAIDDCTRSIALRDDLAQPYTVRGMAHARLGETDLALADFTRAIEIRPVAELYASRAVAYFEKRRLTEAIADFTRAIDLDPSVAETYANRGVAHLAAGDPARAIEDQTKALALKPSATAYRNRGLALLRATRYEDALKDLDAALAMNAGYAQAYADRAKALYRLGRDEAARADVAKLEALGARPDEELVALLRGARGTAGGSKP